MTEVLVADARHLPRQLRLPIDVGWLETRDGDPEVRAIFDRHYSRRHYSDGRNPILFVGPGEKLVLVTPANDAIFVWRKFIDHLDDGSGCQQEGVSCAVFRNEGPRLSSGLILEAEEHARRRWPKEGRFYTLVDPQKIRHKRDPGRCFRHAGWSVCGRSRGGLVILEKWIQ